MGLDFVEMIMELEVRFDVELGDEKVGHVRTAGDLYDVLVAELEKRPVGSIGCSRI